MARRGSVLVMVLFVMLVMALAAVSFTYRASLRMRQGREEVVMLQLQAQARSAAEVAISRLIENTNEFDHRAEPWHTHPPLATEDWLPQWVPDGSQPAAFQAEYYVLDEESKLHVSCASSDMLERLGMGAEQVAALLDWMDADDLPRSGGAESDYYARLRRPYRCKNAPIEMLDELLLVRGFDAASYMGQQIPACLDADAGNARPWGDLDPGWVSLLTCHGSGRVNLNTAPLRVLESLPISARSARIVYEFRQFDGASSGGLDSHLLKKADDLDRLQGLTDADRDVLKAMGCFRSSYFRIFVLAKHRPTGLRVTLEVLVRSSGGDVQILQWKM